MNQLQIFENKEFGKIRTVEINNEPYFVGKDVADILGYTNARKALTDHVDEDDKGVTKCDTLGGSQNMTVINESGLYSLILSSKLPTAKKFKRWVTSEVLPSIRKHGMYTPESVNKPDTYTISGRKYKVEEYVKVKNKDTQEQYLLPLVDIPMASDYKWQSDALESRLKHPEWYEKDENVSEVIERLKAWLSEHTPLLA